MAMPPNLLQAFAHIENDSVCSADWSNGRLDAINPGALIPQAWMAMPS